MAETNLEEVGQKEQSFGDLVLETQKKWRSAKKFPLKEFSQAIDIPESVSRNVTNLVIDNFPTYIPEEVRRDLRDNHPNPIVAVGFLVDKRLFVDKEDGLELETPLWLEGDGDEVDWMNGLEILNEIATDTLAQDVMKNLGHKHKWFAPIATISGIEMRSMAGYKKGLIKTERIFGGQDNFEKFRQNLIVAMLTGNDNALNDQLEDLGYQDLDRFALEIGREAKYSLGMDWLPKKFNKGRMPLLMLAGVIVSDFPGIISLNLAAHSPSLTNMAMVNYGIGQLATGVENPTMVGIVFSMLAFNGFFAINPAILSPHVLVHETCHYLGQNSDHFGLRKWKK